MHYCFSFCLQTYFSTSSIFFVTTPPKGRGRWPSRLWIFIIKHSYCISGYLWVSSLHRYRTKKSTSMPSMTSQWRHKSSMNKICVFVEIYHIEWSVYSQIVRNYFFFLVPNKSEFVYSLPSKGSLYILPKWRHDDVLDYHDTHVNRPKHTHTLRCYSDVLCRW